ncbi:MAG: hypothetical protein S4CHLAM37_15370 [Chlamydiia bacterium]|nr:hypothetical protein [Chlamydiia bacterium]
MQGSFLNIQGPTYTEKYTREISYYAPSAQLYQFVDVPPLDAHQVNQSLSANHPVDSRYWALAYSFEHLSNVKERVEMNRTWVLETHYGAVEELAKIAFSCSEPQVALNMMASYTYIPTVEAKPDESQFLDTPYAEVDYFLPYESANATASTPVLTYDEQVVAEANTLAENAESNVYDPYYNADLNHHLVSTMASSMHLMGNYMQIQDLFERHVRCFSLLSVAYQTLQIATNKIAEQFLVPTLELYESINDELNSYYVPKRERLEELEGMLNDTRQILESYDDCSIASVRDYNHHLQACYMELAHKIEELKQRIRSQPPQVCNVAMKTPPALSGAKYPLPPTTFMPRASQAPLSQVPHTIVKPKPISVTSPTVGTYSPRRRGAVADLTTLLIPPPPGAEGRCNSPEMGGGATSLSDIALSQLSKQLLRRQ